MRIRRNASRLLGSAFSPPPPPPPSLSPPLPPSSPGLPVCKLNCSPWDLIDTSPGPKGPFQEEEEEGGRGSAGICQQLKVEEPITATTADTQTSAGSAAAGIKIEEEKLKVEEEEYQVIEKRTEQEAIRYCNKRGKGWHCTRPSELPHSFCNYHLTMLRSHVSNRRNSINNGAVRGKSDALQSKKQRSKRTAATAEAAAAEADSDSYYYYGGFGPWRGKRRGGADVKVKDEKEEMCDGLIQLDDSFDGYSNGGDCDNNDYDKVTEKREEAIIYCRKNDGKGWHCKRPAQPPIHFAATTSPSSGRTTVPLKTKIELRSRRTPPLKHTVARRASPK